MPLRHRHEYAAVLPRGLQNGSCLPSPELPATHSTGYAPLPAQIRQIRAGA
jgi:hypothetical protein